MQLQATGVLGRVRDVLSSRRTRSRGRYLVMLKVELERLRSSELKASKQQADNSTDVKHQSTQWQVNADNLRAKIPIWRRIEMAAVLETCARVTKADKRNG